MPASEDLNTIREIGEQAAAEPAWADFTAYCDARARGLRKPALAALDRFIAAGAAWPLAERRRFVEWLAVQQTRAWSTAVVIPQPLMVRLARPTLHDWSQVAPDDPRPPYLLALFHDHLDKQTRADHLRRALEADPDYQPARLGLVDEMLRWVDFSQHHVPHGYIGDPAEDLPTLDEAQRLLDGVSPGPIRTERQAEIDEYRRQAEHWRDHGCSPPGSAPRSAVYFFEAPAYKPDEPA